MKGAADSHHSELGRGLCRTAEVERSEGAFDDLHTPVREMC